MSAFFSSNSSEEDGDRLGSGGIVFSHGAEWREQRRFALRNLRDQVKNRITLLKFKVYLILNQYEDIVDISISLILYLKGNGKKLHGISYSR